MRQITAIRFDEPGCGSVEDDTLCNERVGSERACIVDMLLGVIADDFTGASDIANTLAKGVPGQGGLLTVQFLGVPQITADSHIEAGVVSLKSRSIPKDEAIKQSLTALAWLKAQGCHQFVFKYCSTFDSTAEGNIGPVGEALAVCLGVKGVIACPAFPGAGRTVYHGHLFVRDRLLNESGLQNHPLNPMTDPDIRRWLSGQCADPVGLVSWPVVRSGDEAVREALSASADRGETLVIVDAISDEDLTTIGRACKEVRLLTGGSGIALGLPANFIAAGLATGTSRRFSGIPGPEAILAGSCSSATREQIERHATSHPVLEIDVDRAVRGEIDPMQLVTFLRANEGRAPIVYSSASPDRVSSLQERYGRERIAAALDGLFAATARALVENGVHRLVVAGGETSGAVVSTLNLGALAIGPEIDPGVPVLIADGPRPLGLALKSGNFGGPDFFTKALSRLAGTNE